MRKFVGTTFAEHISHKRCSGVTVSLKYSNQCYVQLNLFIFAHPCKTRLLYKFVTIYVYISFLLQLQIRDKNITANVAYLQLLYDNIPMVGQGTGYV